MKNDQSSTLQAASQSLLTWLHYIFPFSFLAQEESHETIVILFCELQNTLVVTDMSTGNFVWRVREERQGIGKKGRSAQGRVIEDIFSVRVNSSFCFRTEGEGLIIQ